MESNARVAHIFAALMQGQTIDAETLTAEYGISLRTLQRDLADIRAALADECAQPPVLQEGPPRHWCLMTDNRQDSIALAVSHIVTGSRAFDQGELAEALAYIEQPLSPTSRSTLHADLRLARHGFSPLTGAKPLLGLLQTVNTAIDQRLKLTFSYRSSRSNLKQTSEIHHAQPVAVFFERFYFYVAMFADEHHGYWLYRLDRIDEILDETKGEKLDYATRFSLQDHWRQTYFIDFGEPTVIHFEYEGFVTTALDAFPTSKVVATNVDGSVVIEAYARIEGALLWLLGQGPRVKVLDPPLLVKRIKTMLTAMQAKYQ